MADISSHMSDAPLQALCRSCGRPVAGNDPSLPCPECGRSIVESPLNTRRGSPWQQAPGPHTWAATGWNVLRHPRACWDNIRPDTSRSFLLYLTNTAIAALLATLAMIPGPQWSPSSRYMLAFFLSLFLLIALLSFVAALGVWLFGHRQWRNRTHAFLIAIIGHASFGWLISGAALGVGCQIMQHSNATRLATMKLAGNLTGTSIVQAIIAWGFILGMLVFFILCGLGCRMLRRANH